VRWLPNQVYLTPTKKMQKRGADLIKETGRPPAEGAATCLTGASLECGLPESHPSIDTGTAQGLPASPLAAVPTSCVRLP
jgi:hypothetical protein